MDTRLTSALRAALLAALLGASGATLAADNPQDPYETYNRAMFKFNDKADQYVMQPVARGYRKAVPSPVRTAISNVFNNLRDVVSFGSNVLRGNVKNAGYDFMRVAINSTFGLGGLIDVASEAGMPNNKNTLGDTFASWGWKNSNYFVYPLLGPSTVRDSLGNTVTSVYSPQRALLARDAVYYPTMALGAVSAREELLDATDSLQEFALDKYSMTRDFYMAMRNKQVGNEQPESADDELFDDEDNSDETASNANENAPAAETLPMRAEGEPSIALPEIAPAASANNAAPAASESELSE